MNYKELLRNSKKCPFCNLKKEEILYKNDFGNVFLAIAPHHKNHLIISPNKHVSRISHLNEKESIGLFNLIIFSQTMIRKFHENFTITYKEGSGSGKTIDHLHINIIPELPIYAKGESSINRRVYGKNEYIREIESFKKMTNL